MHGNYENIVTSEYKYWNNNPSIEMVNDALLGAPTEYIYIENYNYYGPYYYEEEYTDKYSYTSEPYYENNERDYFSEIKKAKRNGYFVTA